jgi:4-alpha-glucanotransferase
MTDEAVRELARQAGIAVQWTDHASKRRRVPLDTIRRILFALGLPCETTSDLSHSRKILDHPRTPALITASVGEPVDLSVKMSGDTLPGALHCEDGTVTEFAARRLAHGIRLPGIQTAGYHTIEIGEARFALAIAPARCITVEDIAPGERIAGLAVQTYGLRSAADCGFGDLAGVTALAASAAPLKVDALALSPAHALFTADPNHFSPYSPSNRLHYNPLLADPAVVFGPERTARARIAAGARAAKCAGQASSLIDWPKSSSSKLTVLRCLFDDFSATDLAANPPTGLAADFAKFRIAGGAPLQQHAVFEALQAARLQGDREAWHWRTWPAQWRDPDSAAVRSFAKRRQAEVLFHMFLQWTADRSFAAAQHCAKQAGMRVGLISDLAVGTNSGGSYAWMNHAGILGGLEIGAPPDLFNAHGQNWGLTTFSPRALTDGGYEPFIATLRACMRHAGGLRIDHAMGFMRLWVTPVGADPRDGAYLAYPLEDLLRLTALESYRHRTIVIGEDLGTVPAGFRDRLAQSGIYGMSILWFERDGGRFKGPLRWPVDTVAMTSTHDLPPVAAWWRGSDIDVRAKCGWIRNAESERATRRKDRQALWAAFTSVNVDDGSLPDADEAARVVDDAVKFIAATPSRLALLPLEDALGLEAQPNLPGTIDEHPNWRRRYDRDAGTMLDAPDVRRRVEILAKRAAR